MPTKPYYGTLADLGLGAISGLRPVMRIRPSEAAFDARDGALVSAVGNEVAIAPITGRFDIDLVPSADLTGSVSGVVGVDYVIEIARFENTVTGEKFHGTDLYRFTAVANGGNVAKMQGGSLLAVWVGPPWPDLPSPAGFYIDTTPPNPYGVVRN